MKRIQKLGVRKITVWLVGLLVCTAATAPAGIVSKSVGELMEFFSRQFAREVAQEGAEQTSGRLVRVLARHGEEFAPVLRKLGPRAVKVADELPPEAASVLRRFGQRGLLVLEQHGDEAVHLFRRCGDDGVELLAAHPGVGNQLVQQYGDDAVQAHSQLDSQQAIRLAKLGDDYARLPVAAQQTFLQNLRAGGDDFVVWVWKRKQEIFGSALLAGGVLITYRAGQGLADKGNDWIPTPPPAPDPDKQPYLAFFDRWLSMLVLLLMVGLVVGGLACYLGIKRQAWNWMKRSVPVTNGQIARQTAR